MGGIVSAIAGFGPCFFKGFTSPKASRSRHNFDLDASTPCGEIVKSGLQLGKPNVRFIRFEHTVRLLEFAKFSTNVAEVGYEVKQAHL
jgi:hypothetical protein